MKIKATNQRGGILLATLGITIVLGILLAGYLTLVSQRSSAVERSQSWNHCVAVAEAGLEEAMAHLNHTKGRNMVTNGWAALAANAFTKSYVMGAGSYSVRLTNTSPPLVETVGLVESQGSVKVAATAGAVNRRVRVTTRFRPEIKGIVARNNALFKDFARADSYNSTLGPYNPLTARDEAFIGNASTFAAQLEVSGSAKIYGSVGTATPGGLKLPLPAPAVIGDAGFVNNSSNGGKVQAGHYTTDLNIPVSTVPPTPFPGMGFALSGGVVGGTNYTYVLNGGNYKVIGSVTMDGALLLAKTMMVTRDSVLWITDTLTVKDSARIIIAPGARLTLYMGKQFYAQGNAEINVGGRPEQLACYGLSSLAEFYMSDFAKMAATAYSTGAKMDFTGNAQFFGGGACNDLVFGGNAQFHYDESLSASLEQPFQITSWTEL